MAKSTRNWERRLKSKPDQLAIDFVQSLSVDQRLYKYDIAGSIAHAQMLKKQKLITKIEFDSIKAGLIEIGKEIAESKFKFKNELEDIHMAIEAALIKKIGDPGRKLHTARSRNDQVATDMRLWMRDEIELVGAKISDLQKAFVAQAQKYTEALMPAYTHMQRAQPIVIASYLLSFVEQFERDLIRLGNCGILLNSSPLGSGAVAGSTLGIDRVSTASDLGFTSVSRNSIDAVSDRDFCAEFIFDCSLISAHLSKLAEDWIIYSSSEFGFISIDDSFCTSSSMMPQKKNPDMLELIRARTGTVYGSLMAMLTVLKAQPTGYNRDLQEDKSCVFSACDTVISCLDMAAAIVCNTEFCVERIAANLDQGFLDATSLAEYLVGRGVPFRKAHGIVGSLVSYCEKKDKSLGELSLEEFGRFSKEIDNAVYKSLGAGNVVSKYSAEGSAGSGQAKEQIRFWKERFERR